MKEPDRKRGGYDLLLRRSIVSGVEIDFQKGVRGTKRKISSNTSASIVDCGKGKVGVALKEVAGSDGSLS